MLAGEKKKKVDSSQDKKKETLQQFETKYKSITREQTFHNSAI